MESLSAFYLFITIAGVAVLGLSSIYLIRTAKKTSEDDKKSCEANKQDENNN